MSNYNNYEDVELVSLCIEGNTSAFDCLVRRHGNTVYRIAFKWCGNKENSEDITQEVFLKLARKVHYYKPTAAFTTWLHQITINTAKDYHRRNVTRIEKENSYANEWQNSSQENTQENEAITRQELRILDKLPEGQKSALILTLLEGLSHKEAARILKCAETTISWRIFKAKKTIEQWELSSK